jgi:hypothetical protein
MEAAIRTARRSFSLRDITPNAPKPKNTSNPKAVNSVFSTGSVGKLLTCSSSHKEALYRNRNALGFCHYFF